MNGRKLFDILRERHPELRGLFISGYADDIVSDGDNLPPDTRFFGQAVFARTGSQELG
jgi:hypothetical protein